MTTIDPAYLEHQRWRWMRPDAERFPRPDWRHRKYWIVPPRPVVTSPYDQTLQPADANEGGIGNTADRRGLAEFKRPIAEIRLDLAHLALLRKAYNPHQPRVPAGNPDGGQWTRCSCVAGATAYSASPRPLPAKRFSPSLTGRKILRRLMRGAC